MIKKRVISVLIFVLALVAVVYLLTLLTMPKYIGVSREGNLISEYYGEVERGLSHQVLFLGDCEVYESFVPAKLWEECGITSYVRGSPQQLIWQSYYLLREMLEYESPDVVVLGVFSMKYGEGQSEAYNRMTLDGMRWSAEKWGAVRASLTEGESALSYALPLLRFHSRWQELTLEDVKYMWRREGVSHNGYLMQTGVLARPAENIEGSPLIDTALPDICFEYLDKIRELCAERGARLVLVKAPTNTWRYWWYDEWDEQIAAYCESYGLDYYNLIDKREIGIDWSCDTYDGGVHLNVWGAEKTTAYFGRLLSEKYGLADLRDDAVTAKIWQDKLEKYKQERQGAGQNE